MATKTVRDIVVAFRLTAFQHAALTEALKKKGGVVGVRSANMLARKAALDLAFDRVTYVQEGDATKSPELYLDFTALAAARRRKPGRV